MVYKNFELPATLIHTVNGKKYTLNGKLLAINESKKTCTMQFGDKTSENVPLKEIYLTESALADLAKKAGKKLKDAAKSLWVKIKGLVKVIGGLLVPVDENGNTLLQFINNPLNLAVITLPDAVKFVPSESTLVQCEADDAKVINNSTIDEAFELSLSNEKSEIETYWSRVMKEYANPENESLTLSETVRMVNETYYHKTDVYESLNESVVSLKSANERIYGKFVNTARLIDLITESIQNQLHPISDKGRYSNYVKPLLIWGAPGIGKTAVIKQAAKYIKKTYSTKLDLVTVACGGLKVDDFELPDTVYNYANQKLAVSTPKTWLPVYDPTGLTPEQLKEVDDFYNSGKYRIRQRMNKDLKDRKNEDGDKVVDFKDIYVGETFDGGIIFFDEFARLRNLKTMDTMMTLCGDRIYQDMVLASQWVTIAAANRLSDDQKRESDIDFRSLWDNAKITRFTHVTFVPTKAEWLKWAREVDDNGYQNVDELICKFIEKSPDGVWYDALDMGSKEIDNDKITQILKDKWGSDSISIEDIKTVGDFIANAGKSLTNIEMVAWNGRTWDQKIAKRFLAALKENLFFGHPEQYEACFSDSKRIREKDGGLSSEEYSVKNLDLKKLGEQLNKVDNKRWYSWTTGKYESIDPDQNLRKNDRLGFVMKYLGEIIEFETGKNSVPVKAWDHYNSIDAIIDEADIRAIYEKGGMKSANSRRDDNVIFDNMSEYNKVNTVNWKSNMQTVDEVISMVLDAFDKQINIDEILRDQKRIEANIGKFQVTDAEVNRYVNDYTLHLTDETGREIKTIPTLFNKAMEYDENLKGLVVHVLKNSRTAEKLANVAMWISKVAIQINQNTPITAAVGVENSADSNTLADRFYNVISQNQKALAFYDKEQKIRQYDILLPAMTILKAMRFYRDSH